MTARLTCVIRMQLHLLLGTEYRMSALQDRYMTRDAAEMEEVLQSVSDMLKPFYAQVIDSHTPQAQQCSCMIRCPLST